MATDFVIKSNQASLILNTLKASGIEDLSYSQPRSFPVLAKEILSLSPLQTVSGSLYSKKVRFDIPRSSMVKDMILKTDFTTAIGAALTTGAVQDQQNTLAGINLVESMELRTRSRTICQNTQDGLRSWASVAPISDQLALKRRAKMLDQTTGALLAGAAVTSGATYSATVYTRPKFYFMESDELAMDSGFVEQTQLLVTYNTQAYAGISRDLNTVTATLYVTYWQPELQYYNMLRSKNFGRATPLQQLIYDSITEVNVASSTTSNQFDIKVDVPAFVTFVNILNNQTSGLAARFLVNTFSTTFTSRKLFDSLPALVGTLESDLEGCVSIDIDNTDSSIGITPSQSVALYWGLHPKAWDMNSGAVSYAQIDNPSITVNHSTLGTAANYNVNYTHFFWCLLSTDGSNGSLIISSST